MVVTFFVLGIIDMPTFAQSADTYQVKDPSGGESYNVNYSISGATISNISIEPKISSLAISLQTTSDGSITLTLPRPLIDAKAGSADDQFFVLEDGQNVNFQESKTDTARTLTIPFPDGTERIEVVGTQAAPEFGTLSFVVLAVAILAIITVSTKTRLRLGP